MPKAKIRSEMRSSIIETPRWRRRSFELLMLATQEQITLVLSNATLSTRLTWTIRPLTEVWLASQIRKNAAPVEPMPPRESNVRYTLSIAVLVEYVNGAIPLLRATRAMVAVPLNAPTTSRIVPSLLVAGLAGAPSMFKSEKTFQPCA